MPEVKDLTVDSDLDFGFDWYEWLLPDGGKEWRPRMDVVVGDIILPRTPNGFYYIGTNGKTGTSEPSFPTSQDGTVLDGTVTWTAKALDAIDTSDWTITPNGPTVDEKTNDNRFTKCRVTGFTAATSYTLVNTITSVAANIQSQSITLIVG